LGKNYKPLSHIAKKFYKETGAIHFLGESKEKIGAMLDIISKSHIY
jgi:hypothetical protein